MADTPARSTGKRLDVRQPHRRAIRNGMFEWNLERAQEAAAREREVQRSGIQARIFSGGHDPSMIVTLEDLVSEGLLPASAMKTPRPWAQEYADACRALVTPEPPFWLALWRLITRRA